MNLAEQKEFDEFSAQLEAVIDEALPIVKSITVHTRRARRAMGGRSLNNEGEIVDEEVDTLTLSNEQVELAILLQRLGERISNMGYVARAAEEFYKRVMEGHKVRLTQIGEERIVEEKDKDSTTGYRKVKKFVPVAAGVADSMKIELAHEAFMLHNSCQQQLESLVQIRKSTDKTIDTMRSKLSYEKANDNNAAR
jgi:hypothetical protein